MTTEVEDLRTNRAMMEFAIEPGDSQEEILAKGIAGAIATVVRPLVRRIAALERERRSAMDADGLSDAILGAIDRECDPLETRIKALEVAPTMRFAGTWEPGRAYGQGACVVRGGSLWFCEAPTAAAPGGPDDGWRLVTKRGSIVE